MSKNRRMELLQAFATAGERGLTMTAGQFNSQDVSKLEGLIERQPGPTGVYCITEQGLNYLVQSEPVAA